MSAASSPATGSDGALGAPALSLRAVAIASDCGKRMSTREERWVDFDASARAARERFPLLTADEVARRIRWARSPAGLQNSVRDQISKKFLDLKLGKSTGEAAQKMP